MRKRKLLREKLMKEFAEEIDTFVEFYTKELDYSSEPGEVLSLISEDDENRPSKGDLVFLQDTFDDRTTLNEKTLRSVFEYTDTAKVMLIRKMLQQIDDRKGREKP
eukprot:UN22082